MKTMLISLLVASFALASCGAPQPPSERQNEISAAAAVLEAAQSAVRACRRGREYVAGIPQCTLDQDILVREGSCHPGEFEAALGHVLFTCLEARDLIDDLGQSHWLQDDIHRLMRWLDRHGAFDNAHKASKSAKQDDDVTPLQVAQNAVAECQRWQSIASDTPRDCDSDQEDSSCWPRRFATAVESMEEECLKAQVLVDRLDDPPSSLVRAVERALDWIADNTPSVDGPQ